MRELRNILERAMAMARGARLDVEHLPAEVTNPERAPATHPVHVENDFVACADHEISEAEHLREVLHKHRGNRRLAAQELGITERTLYRRLKSHSLI
jgi:transcriptional regulator with PAS, ATPase and Fis domain